MLYGTMNSDASQNSAFGPQLVAWTLTLLSGVGILALYHPFSLPLTGDRAYILYVSQTAYFTGDIYANSSFGYTPLGPLLGAAVFLVGGWVSDASTLMLARIAGMLCWLACLLGLLQLGHRFFGAWTEAAVMAAIFAGFSVIPLMSAVNLEPKMLVLLFQIWALACIYRRRYMLAGLSVSLAAMCWQPAVVIVPALALFLLLDTQQYRLRYLGHFFFGLLAGTLPVLVYLSLTRSWMAFWQQAVLRKLDLEGAELLEQPLHWLTNGLFPALQSEWWIFLLAGLGLALFLATALLNLLPGRRGAGPRHPLLMALFSGAWVLFNSLEFQRVADLIPILPALCYWPAFLLMKIRETGLPRLLAQCLALLFAILALHDLPQGPPVFTLAEQQRQMAAIRAIDADPMVFDFEEYHVLNELPLRTRFIRFNLHDDYLIRATVDGGCEQLIEQLRESAPGTLAIRLRGPAHSDRSGDCARALAAELYAPEPFAELTIDGSLPCPGCLPRKDTIRFYAYLATGPAGNQRARQSERKGELR
jgi:hypothetical protein